MNQVYLSSPHLEASLAMTFRACSSPAPTPVKPQPTPTILSHESVHITLVITHHTWKRPSTSPQTTWLSISPLMSALKTHTYGKPRERKRKETTKGNSNKRSKAKGKAKNKIT
jgi:hypothetical protein